MRHLITLNSALLGTALFGSALAAPLLGTTGAFSASGPCKAAHCTLSSREPISRTITDYRYTFPPESSSPDQMQEAGPTFSVIRVNNVVTSVGFSLGEQDSNFYRENYLSRLISKVFSFATGATFTSAMLSKFEQQCEQAQPKETTTKLGAFTLSCVNSVGEFTNARRVNYRVF